jgi:hypothetical protein
MRWASPCHQHALDRQGIVQRCRPGPTASQREGRPPARGVAGDEGRCEPDDLGGRRANARTAPVQTSDRGGSLRQVVRRRPPVPLPFRWPHQDERIGLIEDAPPDEETQQGAKRGEQQPDRHECGVLPLTGSGATVPRFQRSTASELMRLRSGACLSPPGGGLVDANVTGTRGQRGALVDEGRGMGGVVTAVTAGSVPKGSTSRPRRRAGDLRVGPRRSRAFHCPRGKARRGSVGRSTGSARSTPARVASSVASRSASWPRAQATRRLKACRRLRSSHVLRSPSVDGPSVVVRVTSEVSR